MKVACWPRARRPTWTAATTRWSGRSWRRSTPGESRLMARNRLVYVGAFVVFGVVLFAVGLFMIGNRRMLFDRTFRAYAEFANINGLQNGAIVRVAGMDAGEVDEIG